jgi:hypothetical protein
MALLASGVANAMEVVSGSLGFNVDTGKPQLIIGLDSNPLTGKAEALAGMGTDLEGRMAALAELQQQMGQLTAGASDPQSVHITIPLPAYGSGGSFSDAIVQSGEGTSIDPALWEQSARIAYTGQVTINEFTKYVIAGEYNGDLYVPEISPRRRARGVGSVAGWFRIALPMLSDPRISRDLPPTEIARLQGSSLWDVFRTAGLGLDDAERLGAVADIAREQQRELKHGAGDASRGGGPAGVDAMCHCICQYLATLPEDDQCRRECKAQGLTCAFDEAGTDPEMAALIEQLAAMGLPAEAQASMIESLSQLSPEERKQMLDFYRSAGPPPEQ